MTPQPSRHPTLPLEQYTVGWISALPIEAAAAEELLDEEHEELPSDPKDPTLYTLGRISGHAVVIGSLPAGRPGTTTAAVIATRMTTKFRSIRIGLMVGIGGGNPSEADIRLGDVVVSQPDGSFGGVVQYEMGKETLDGFKQTGHLDAPPEVLLSALTKVQRNFLRGRSHHLEYLTEIETKNPRFRRDRAGSDDLYCTDTGESEELVKRQPREADELVRIHFGTIASANKVIKNAEARNALSKRLGGILCFEMEAAGLMNTFRCLVIRGICDYADAHKNDRWQHYAAASAAAYAKEILTVIPSEEIEKMMPIKVPWVVPFKRNLQFTGREKILDQLNQCFIDPSKHPHVAVHGLGGCGKSAVVIEFAYRVREQNCAVFWVSALSKERFGQSFRDIARALQIPEANDEKRDILGPVHRKLDDYDRGKFLMVVDNLDNKSILWDPIPDTISPGKKLWDYLPQNEKCMMLFTTRNRKIAVDTAPNQSFPLDELSASEAQNLLHVSLQDHPALYSDAAASELTKLLTYLPLAIVQAVAYIKRNNTPLQRYLGMFRDADDSLIELLQESFEDSSRNLESGNAVATTWLLSFQQIQETDPQAAAYLSFVACIASQNIPRSIFPPAKTENEQEKAIGTLTAFKFLTQSEDGDHYDMHLLVHRVTRNWLQKSPNWIETAELAVERLAELIPYGGHEQLQQYPIYLLHGQSTAEIKEILESQVTIDLLDRIGRCYQFLGQYNHAVATHKEVLARRTRAMGSNHEATLTSMNELGLALGFQGHYVVAEKIHRENLQLKQKVLGKEDPRTLTSMHNLALVLQEQGKYVEAEAIYRETLQLSQKVLGKKHPDTMISMENLANVLRDRNRHVESEAMYRETLQLNQTVLGRKHPDTLISMNNLALVLGKQGNYVEAEAIHREELQLKQTVLGKKHPDTLISMNNLAWSWKCQGRLDAAISLLSFCANLSDGILGPAHPISKERHIVLASWREESNQNSSRMDNQETETRTLNVPDWLDTML